MRNYVLVSYDITNPKRLQKVYKTMRGFGDNFQKSVFLCQLSSREEMIMKMKLNDIIKPSEDQIVIIKLGKIDHTNISNPNTWTIMGRKLEIKDNSTLIF